MDIHQVSVYNCAKMSIFSKGLVVIYNIKVFFIETGQILNVKPFRMYTNYTTTNFIKLIKKQKQYTVTGDGSETMEHRCGSTKKDVRSSDSLSCRVFLQQEMAKTRHVTTESYRGLSSFFILRWRYDSGGTRDPCTYRKTVSTVTPV